MIKSIKTKIFIVMGFFSFAILFFSGLIVFKPESSPVTELYIMCSFCSVGLIYYTNKLIQLYFLKKEKQ